ncbi:hypothetical protein MSSAC_1489 [Methanosarcina siciliae C2J]|uniref:DUF2110 family protein n=3 Tax=Methanosarcina siciliae TaxID=38027 RepID=A0A0E3PDI3_9EURY|nr:DUF2110 family protein [Methanosarcina siciliae]AKB28245.1 hypothetical protein MSSIT_1526 [Methanosarcina siciliae T4/M]AKB32160.1 hypothetical protein MSSIH_1470 [Methanosarcina siciliae HI350]AKB36079.1 hypothetical protein MSSAC_1489 [Methanosarcina siciliae C2J]
MEKVVTLQHIYGKKRDRMAELLKSLVENELKDLEVKVEVSITPENWAEFTLEGEDEEVSANLLKSRYGSPAKKAEPGKVYLGFLQAFTEDAFIANIGIPVRIEAEELKALGSGKPKQLASRFGLVPHLPVEVEVFEANKKIKASFTKKQFDLWWGWKKASTDRVIINAATRSEIKSAVKKTGHGRDIYEIERLGLLEHAVVCREKTDGPGIVAAIGPRLKSEMGVVIGDSR